MTAHKHEPLPCTPVRLPDSRQADAGALAAQIFPPNAPRWETDPQRIGVLASKWWGDRVRTLTVGFMQTPSREMIDKVLAFANLWGAFSKARFRWTQSLTEAVVRVAFDRGGYWSYVGTDNLLVPADRNTMNLEGFTVQTPESEWHRVVKHEFGHALGCPHEQNRRAVLARLDRAKTIAYFMATQGWTAEDVVAQVLTPVEERSLMNPSPADVASIMCYQFPASITVDGRAIPGGQDFSAADREYFGKTYPADAVVAPPPPPGLGEWEEVVVLDRTGAKLVRFKRTP